MLWLHLCVSCVCIPIQNKRHLCAFALQPNAGVTTHQFSHRGDSTSQHEQYICAMYIRAHVRQRWLRQAVNLDKACRWEALVRADARPASTWWICWEGAEPLDTLQWLRDGEGGGGRRGGGNYSEPLGDGETAQDVGLHRERGDLGGSGRQEARWESGKSRVTVTGKTCEGRGVSQGGTEPDSWVMRRGMAVHVSDPNSDCDTPESASQRTVRFH